MKDRKGGEKEKEGRGGEGRGGEVRGGEGGKMWRRKRRRKSEAVEKEEGKKV